MTKILFAALLAGIAATLAVHALSAESVARNTPVPASFDIAMPVEPEAVDATVVTAAPGAHAERTQ